MGLGFSLVVLGGLWV